MSQPLQEVHGGPAATLRVLEGHGARVRCVKISPNGERAFSSGDDHTLRVHRLGKSRTSMALRGHSAGVGVIEPAGRVLATGGDDFSVLLWDPDAGACLGVLERFRRPISGVRQAANATALVVTDGLETLTVCDLRSRGRIATLAGHSDLVTSFAVAPDGCRVVSASNDRTLRVWDLRAGACLHVLRGHEDVVNGVAISPDGQTAVSAGADRILRSWDLSSGRLLRELAGSESWICPPSFTPDGRQVVSGGGHGVLRVWEMDTGACARAFPTQADAVEVDPSGEFAASMGTDRTLRIWDLHEGLRNVIRAGAAITALSEFHPKGRLVFGTEEGQVVLVSLPRREQEAGPLATAGRVLLSVGTDGSPTWEGRVKAACAWCGARFPVEDDVVDLIESHQRKEADGPVARFPWELPGHAWADLRLHFRCPACQGALRLNPFFSRTPCGV